MKQLNLLIELTRLKRPIGYMLLFWPCAWGLTLAYDFSKNLNDYFFYLSLFFLGSILMRSAGCIVNDISDKEFDKKVSRTKNRPIASNQVSIKLGIFYSLILSKLPYPERNSSGHTIKSSASFFCNCDSSLSILIKGLSSRILY